MVSEVIINAIKAAFAFIRKVIRVIVSGILNFAAHIVGWFKSLNLEKEKDIPFIADPEKFKEILKTAPVKNVGIFEGVYDEQNDEIVSNRLIDADELDDKTLQVLGDDSLVVLS